MPHLKFTATFATPTEPNMPSDTPEVFAVAAYVRQNGVQIKTDSKIPAVSPAAFDIEVPAGVYDVEVQLADSAWKSIGTVLAKSMTALDDVVRPVLTSLVQN